MDKNYTANFCVDTPDSRDYSAEEYLSQVVAMNTVAWPRDKVTVQNQKSTPACTRFAIVHVCNGANINEYVDNGYSYTELDAMDVWNRSNKILSLQAAMSQMKTEGVIEGWVAIKNSIEKSKMIQMIKQVLELGHFIYTGSSNGDWGKTGKAPYNYTIRTDGKFVGHAWDIVGDDDDNQRFVCVNSWGDKWGDRGYFYLPYELVDQIYNKYPIIDKDNSGDFKKFKRAQKAKQIVDLCHDFWVGELDGGTQILLHSMAEKLRDEYRI